MSAMTRQTFVRVCACKKFGTAIAARMAMMTTTISSSINVNPYFLSFIGLYLFLWLKPKTASLFRAALSANEPPDVEIPDIPAANGAVCRVINDAGGPIIGFSRLSAFKPKFQIRAIGLHVPAILFFSIKD